MPGWDELGVGAPIIGLLAILSMVSLTIIAVKVVQLWNVRKGGDLRAAAVDQWKSGNVQAALAAIARGRTPADRVAGFAMEAMASGLTGPPLEAELIRRGNEEVADMGSMLRQLDLIAMISPLLGLLGTVLGMIQSFMALEMAQGAANASILAGGIWQALLTTAAGLIAAIPAAVGASMLSGRVDRAALTIESAVGQLMLAEEYKAG